MARKKVERIQVQLSQETLDKVKKIAKEENQSKSKTCEFLISDGLTLKK
jgi:hypothetical protein